MNWLTDDDLVKVPYPSTLVVWIPLCLDPSDGGFGRFDLAALCGCHTLNVCYVMLSDWQGNYSKRILLALAGRHLKHLGQATGIMLLGRRGSINSGLN